MYVMAYPLLPTDRTPLPSSLFSQAAIAEAKAKHGADIAAKKAAHEAAQAEKAAAREAEDELKRKRAERFGAGESPSKKQKH